MMSSSVRVWVSTVALMRFADAAVSGLTSVAPDRRLLGHDERCKAEVAFGWEGEYFSHYPIFNILI